MSELKRKTAKSVGIDEPTRDQERGDQTHPTMPPGRTDTALKRYENLTEDKDKHSDTSLQEHAKERAKHPDHLNAGTPYDWEDLDEYKKELKRLDRQLPKGPETP